MMSQKLRIGYVPEHFCSPLLQLSASDDSFELVSCPSGTGEMITKLRENQIDVSIALTEALITGIAKKSAEYKLVGTYVKSPLIWAVITGDKAPYNSIKDLKGQKFGISRIGSGSQIMVSYMAMKEGWFVEGSADEVAPLDFIVNDTFQVLRNSVNDGTTAAFMWEKYTTKPFVDTHEVRFIGEVPTPWASWSIAASSRILSSPPLSSSLSSFLSNLTKFVTSFASPASRASPSVDYIVEKFEYKREDVEAWLARTEYKEGELAEVEGKTVKETLEILEKAGVLKKPEGGWNIEEFVDEGVAKLV